MTPDALFDEFSSGFDDRRFSAGLLVAFIDFYVALGVPDGDHADFAAVLARFPQRTVTSARKRANTLIVARGDGSTLSLRPFYNAAERFFRAEHHRYDYPSCAPHATQAWIDYRPWLDALAGYGSEVLAALRARVVQYVLDTLVSQDFDPSTVRSEPPLFLHLLEDFDLSARRGEPTGAAYQGLAFGFLRADNPHLQIEIDKVRTGSKRLQRIGDIDAWDGARLALSAEVKQFELREDDVPDLAGFAHETGRRGALGLIVATSFRPGTRERLEANGLKTLSRADLRRIVALWDPLKQRTAVASLIYYARHVEKNASLGDRIDAFLQSRTRTQTP
ncbi:hypothetical protein [Plasticicumulans sp.]|uniref:hypothetical protein n=1 Tax=Plasticicumulans sp. TaxID=2307179 RepID=UPI0039617273